MVVARIELVNQLVPPNPNKQLLAKHGLSASDFQKLVLRFQGEPRIAQALQHSQTQQAEALARMGLPV